MKITTVAVECCFNTGNYENQRYRLEAQLEEGDTPETVADSLKHAIHTMADKEDTYYERNTLRAEIRDLQNDIQEARNVWDQTRAFLVAQGLRPDAPEFPFAASSVPRLPVATSTQVQVAETGFE